MAAGFGADTDIWGIVDTNWELQSSTQTPGTSNAQCMDSNGDVSAETVYDTTIEYSATYKNCKNFTIQSFDTTNGIDMRLGKVISGKVMTSAELTTGNTEYNTLTISGRTTPSADSATKKYDWLTDTQVTLARKAQPIGVIKDTVSRVTGSTLSASVNVAVCQDSVGTTTALQVHGGRVEGTTNLCGASGTPGAAADTANGWTENVPISESQENTGYSTGDIGVFKNLVGSDT